MTFVGDIFAQLKSASNTVVLQEIRDGQVTGVTGTELLELIRKARTFLASQSLKKGDRCGLLSANGIRWIAMDLAAMAEGLIVVPLYFRQAPTELVAMMKDSAPAARLLRRLGIANWNPAELVRGAAAFLVRRDLCSIQRTGSRPATSSRRRSRNDHLHLWYVGRIQGRCPDSRQCRVHAGVHLSTPRFANGRAN